MTQASNRTPDQGILSAWQQGLSQTSKDVTFKQALLQQQGELLPCFVDHYQRLKALPRRMRRTLQRQWRRSLAGLALLLVLGQAPALAATINVGGQCTLVRAINSANTDTAVGGCTRGSGADRLVLPRNSTQTLTAVNNDRYNGLPVIRSDITIAGNNSTIRRARTAPEFRIFSVDDGDLTLRNATVSGGRVPNGSGGGINAFYSTVNLINSVISNNYAHHEGGGVFVYLSRLTITDSTISGNSSRTRGGGVYSRRDSALTITNSTITGNTAGSGAGVGFYDADAILTNCNITNNAGDGLLVDGGGTGIRTRITKSTISGNEGRGVFIDDGGSATTTNSTISGNSSDRYGGGMFVGYYGTFTVTNSTITGNSSTFRGGGAYVDSEGTLTHFVCIALSVSATRWYLVTVCWHVD